MPGPQPPGKRQFAGRLRAAHVRPLQLYNNKISRPAGQGGFFVL